jgi:hypothetical protein
MPHGADRTAACDRRKGARPLGRVLRRARRTRSAGAGRLSVFKNAGHPLPDEPGKLMRPHERKFLPGNDL